MDPVDQANNARDRALLEEIRRELHVGRQLQVIAILAIVVTFAVAAFTDATLAVGPGLVLALIVIIIATSRNRQREQLLRKAADKLEDKAK